MHFGDSIFIFLLALVLFGPKKLPEIGRTIGKLLAEFRRASNEFKFQIQEELRTMEEDERRKKLADQQAQKPTGDALPADTTASAGTPTILPPSTGTPVSTATPYAMPVESMPADATVTPSAAEVPVEPSAPPIDSTAALLPPVELTASTNGTHPAEPVESIAPDEPVHHG